MTENEKRLAAAIRHVWEQRVSDNWAWCVIEDAFGLMPLPTKYAALKHTAAFQHWPAFGIPVEYVDYVFEVSPMTRAVPARGLG